jgi:hypothetical protein
MKKAIFLALVAAIPGVASASKPVDNYVSTLIEGRDYGAAEDALSARLLRSHDDPRSLLNLAFLYQSTDRWDQADAVYARVLAAPDMQVATNTGQVKSSHDIARGALNHGTVTVASR